MTKLAVLGLGFGCLALTAGCGADGESGSKQAEAHDASWQKVDREYPFVGEHGETVCAEWRVLDPETGERTTQREWYHFDRMNDALAGRVTVDDPDAVAAARAELTEVVGCDDARKFTRLRVGYTEAHPSLATAPPASNLHPDNEEFSQVTTIVRVADSRNFVNAPTVRLLTSFNRCSGVLIGEKILLTAAHCLPARDPFQTYHVTIDYGVGTNCINVGGCDGSTWANASAFPFPGYTGTGDTPRDLAVVAVNQPWFAPADTSLSWARIITRRAVIGDQFWVEGYGWNANSGGSRDVARRSNNFETVSGIADSYWKMIVTQGRGRACHGDSGGPALNDFNLLGKPDLGFSDAIFGVVSKVIPNPFDHCPDLGDSIYYSQLSDKASFIEPFFVGGCYHGSSNGNAYIRCW